MNTLIRKIKKTIPQGLKNIFHLIRSFFAVLYFGYPANNLQVIGVTGTDGKTTTSTMIYEMIRASGKKVALISTVAAYIGDKEIETGFHVTTPDSWMLQKLFKKIVDMGYDYVVLEVTSHGLDQYRLFGSNIQIGVLTNVTNEHLDYHKSYDNYLHTKAKMFSGVKVSILNKLDMSYEKIKDLVNQSGKVLAYDFNTLPPKVKEIVDKRFPEEYNQLNSTAAYLAAKEIGVDDKSIMSAITKFSGIPGRMEEVKNTRGFRIIVDFAHTPNALESVLTNLKHQLSKGERLISIFGCASERDNNKRPVMGEISTRIADLSIFTAEDPRFEDVNEIIKQIANGAEKNKNHTKYYSIADRQEAINFGINKLAKKGDIVVICGKGHEKSMNYFGVERPWSDRDAVLTALKSK